ncbi:MAG: hypothetical protein PHR66_06920 [Desulfuromonadaceae bacterium]|nr:hypothetical protein [Desulfuromonadaceae bacterium]
MHQDEVNKINSQLDDFSKKMGISQDEVKELLTTASKYYNDKNAQQNTPALSDEQIKAGLLSTTKYTKDELDKAYNYLLNNSKGEYFIDVNGENMTPQKMFTSTKEQYNDSNYNPNSSKGLVDSSYVFMPSMKIGQTLSKTTTELSPIIIQKTEQFYDNATLGMIQGINNIAPNITNKYILDPTNSLKIIGGIDVANDIFNESSPFPSSIKGAYGRLINNFSGEDEQSINEKIEYLKQSYQKIKKDLFNEK